MVKGIGTVAGLLAEREGSGIRALVRLVVLLTTAVALSAAGFLAVMAREGQEHSVFTAVYWTIVTMSTLGYGDIVFTSELGRLYSVAVLVVGAVLVLVLLPFTFIQLVYLPWRAAARAAQAPRHLPVKVRDHLLVTGLEPVSEALIRRARAIGMPYAVVVEDTDTAVALHEDGYRVVVGRLDDPDTYRAARVEQSALVYTAWSDARNANVVFTVREVTDAGTVVATANSPDAVDVLELAGADHVLQLGEVLGRALARRVLAPTARSSPISRFENLVIAEASAAGTELVGLELRELDLRARFGVSVVGVWNRGELQMARPSLKIDQHSILLLAGREEQLAAYDAAHGGESTAGDPGTRSDLATPVVIIGGGRVGRATARTLAEAGTPSRIVERDRTRIRAELDYVLGDAADLDVLREAGIDRTPAVVVTTHDDDINLFLTLYARRLRDDVQILGRVVQERNLSTMHRAGADFVLSYASAGTTEVWNALRENSTLLLTEGLLVFRVPVPPSLVGRRLRDLHLPEDTGSSVIATLTSGRCRTELDIDEPLRADTDLVLIGDVDAEERFARRYVETSRSAAWWRRG
jgi:voltage-gated potassium channel